MTATNFRDLLARALARSFYTMSGGLPDAITSDPDAGDHQLAFDILRTPVPWVDCPTCDTLGWVGGPTPGATLVVADTCPTCSGTGKATVAQLLAWGSAVAQTDPEDWIEFGDQRSAVDGYRNRILGVQP